MASPSTGDGNKAPVDLERAVKKFVKFFDNAMRQRHPCDVPCSARELEVDPDTKKIFAKKTPPVILKQINDWIRDHCCTTCQANDWPLPATSIFQLHHVRKGNLCLSKKWSNELWSKQKTLYNVLFQAVKEETEANEFGWYWGSLQSPSTKVAFSMSDACRTELHHHLNFDDAYFPKDDGFIMHYLKMHLRHHLAMNNTELYSKNVAWFGRLPEGDAQCLPHAILFNTNLLSRWDRQVQLLLLCVPHNRRDEMKPWFGVRVVQSSELSMPHRMTHHLSPNVTDVMGAVTEKNAILLDEEARPQVPVTLNRAIPREMMTFDPDAWPDRVHYGDFVKHMRDDVRKYRIHEAHVGRLTDDDLRSRAAWAVERARDSPNVVLAQWFCDKGAEVGRVQLILPLTLDAPPALAPRLGLVVEARKHEDFFFYNVLTALPLGIVFNNVLILQPRGGHWLTATHPDVATHLTATHADRNPESD